MNATGQEEGEHVLQFSIISQYLKSQIFVQIQFWQNFTIFSGKQSCQQLKNLKPQHFHEFFTQNNSTIFLGKSKLNFWTKNEDFEQCAFVIVGPRAWQQQQRQQSDRETFDCVWSDCQHGVCVSTISKYYFFLGQTKGCCICCILSSIEYFIMTWFYASTFYTMNQNRCGSSFSSSPAAALWSLKRKMDKKRQTKKLRMSSIR